MHAAPRDHSLDNVRTAMVLFILLLHASCAYAFGIPWWHAQDHKSQLFDLLIVCVDAFALPVLFFVAGTFSRSSFDRRGPREFMRAKLKRLGLPTVVVSAFYLPAMVYVGYLHRAAQPTSFFEYWLHWMATATDWGFNLFTSMESAAGYADAFSPHHLWFMTLLLVFFAGYALWRALFPESRQARLSLPWVIVLWGATMALGLALVNTAVQDWAWARLGPFFLLQLTRLPVYAGCFLLGVAARPRLGGERPMPGSMWLWLPVFLLAEMAMLACAKVFIASSGPLPWPLALGHGALRAVLVVSAICLCANAGRRFLSGASRWRQSLAASSYDIYILHMPLTVFVQAALLAAPLPLALKMALAFLVPALFFWWLSRVMARRGAWLPAVLLAVFFVGFNLLYPG